MGVFGDARKIETPAKGKGKKQPRNIDMVGVEVHAAVRAEIANLVAIEKSLAEELKGDASAIFKDDGEAAKKRPENFRAVEGIASSGMEMKIRASSSPITEEELPLLNEAGIPTVEITKKLDAILINPENSPETMKRIEAIFDREIKAGRLPKDCVLHQVGEKATVLADNALDVLFTKPREVIDRVFNLCTVLSIKATVTDCAKAAEIVAKLLGRAKDEDRELLVKKLRRGGVDVEKKTKAAA